MISCGICIKKTQICSNQPLAAVHCMSTLNRIKLNVSSLPSIPTTVIGTYIVNFFSLSLVEDMSCPIEQCNKHY